MCVNIVHTDHIYFASVSWETTNILQEILFFRMSIMEIT